jgi:hypothetical protein
MNSSKDIHSVLAPIPLELFATRHWEKRSLHIKRSSPGYFSSLGRIEDLDRLINLSFTNYHIFSIEGERFIPPRPRNPTKTTLSEFYKEFASGRTLALRQMHVRSAPVSELVSELSRQSGFSLTADLVAAPARSRNAGSFADSQSLFVLQLEGTSTWSIPKEKFQPLAAPEEGAPAAAQEGGWRVSLSPGDTLYLPRGTSPGGTTSGAALPMIETGDGHSLHLVLSIQRVTWADLLAKTVVLASGKNVELRRALGFGGPLRLSGKEKTVSRFQELMAAALANPSWKEASHLLACDHKRRLPVLPDGHFDQLRHVESIDAETLVTRRAGVDGRVHLVDGLVELLLPGYFYQGPEKLYLALDFISETARFKVKEIPGWYTDEERIALTKHLLSMGVLTFAASPITTSELEQA